MASLRLARALQADLRCSLAGKRCSRLSPLQPRAPPPSGCRFEGSFAEGSETGASCAQASSSREAPPGGRDGEARALQQHLVVLRKFARTRHWQQALQWLKVQLPAEGLAADEACYSAVLGACARADPREDGKAGGAALRLLGEMRAAKLVCDAEAINKTMSACSRSRLWQQAIALFEDEELASVLDAISLNTCIGACERGAAWALAVHLLLRGMPARGESATAPDFVAYGAAMGACTKSTKWEASLRLLDLAGAACGSRNLLMYTTAMSACSRALQWEKVLQLLNDVGKDSLTPDVMTYGAAVAACGKASEWAGALHLVSEMRLQGMGLDAFVLRALVAACGRAKAWEVAFAAIAEAQRGGLHIDHGLQAALRAALEGVPEAADLEAVWKPAGRDTDDEAAQSHEAGMVAAVSRPSHPVMDALTAGRSAGTYLAYWCGSHGEEAAKSLLQSLSADSKLIVVCGDAAAHEVARRLSVTDPRVVSHRDQLGRVARVVPREVSVAGVWLDPSAASLPAKAARWLADASADELTWALQQHGEQDDSILWARVALAILSERRRQGPAALREGGNKVLVDVVVKAVDRLGDAAGPPARLAVDAIRAYLSNEDRDLVRALGGVLNNLAIGGRCVVICSRSSAAAAVKRVLRTLEECNPKSVDGWPPDKIAALYPSTLGTRSVRSSPPAAAQGPQDWCVRDIEPDVSLLARAASAGRIGTTYILEKHLRTTPVLEAVAASRAAGKPAPLEQLFVKPKHVPEFQGATA
eukprot:TRINITY_DN39235_c0_g1_i2.p1 TRINITY_DN39235_c0_g1~~TRINITY_DN39235_c0_g1_i2.p1  ORF type:complete len:760 (+),score=156.87 TRINITY_DN39235_c0_g1_i2:19-2298(+)